MVNSQWLIVSAGLLGWAGWRQGAENARRAPPGGAVHCGLTFTIPRSVKRDVLSFSSGRATVPGIAVLRKNPLPGFLFWLFRYSCAVWLPRRWTKNEA